MAYPSVTYTFTNSTTASATEVNQNFTDIINGLSDGTKDISIAAITCAGTATFNGACNFGNASSDDITITGSISSSIPIKAATNVDIGTSTDGLRIVYLEGNNKTVGLGASGAASGSYLLYFPPAADVKGQSMVSGGSGAMAWAPEQYLINPIVDADYTVLDNDGYAVITVHASTTNRTVTLPTAADNTNRIITIKKIDSEYGYVIIKGEGAGETIDGISGTTGIAFNGQYNFLTLKCDGSIWHVINGCAYEYCFTTGTWDADDNTMGYGEAGATMGGATTALRRKTITWVNAIRSSDSFRLDIDTGNGWATPGHEDVNNYHVENTRDYGAGILGAAAGKTLVDFANYSRASGTTWNSGGAAWVNTYKWRAVKRMY